MAARRNHRGLLRLFLKLRLRLYPAAIARLLAFWHWAARWNWFSLAVSGGLGGMARIGEYALSILLLSIAALGAVSKIAHSRGMDGASERERRLIRTTGIVGAVAIFAYMVLIATLNASRDDAWSNFPRIIAYVDSHLRTQRLVFTPRSPPYPLSGQYHTPLSGQHRLSRPWAGQRQAYHPSTPWQNLGGP
jgi:hypothetical protein